MSSKFLRVAPVSVLNSVRKLSNRRGFNTIGAATLKPELAAPRVVCLEEHFLLPALLDRFPTSVIQKAKLAWPDIPILHYAQERLPEIGGKRVADMDKGGISVQILSLAGMGAMLLRGQDGVAFARDANDMLFDSIRASPQPTRFGAFAHLPMCSPDAAADELARCVKDLGMVGVLVNGTTEGKFLDDPSFKPVLAAASELDVPIYIHPAPPPEAVWKAYYDFPDAGISTMLATAGWGWHSEVGIHVLRMALRGTFDEFPKLKVVIGHQGEMLPMMMQRFDNAFDAQATGLKRPVSQTLREQVYVTLSGLFSMPPTMCAIQTFGIDHVMFSNDYPYWPAEACMPFIKVMQDYLAPEDVKKILYKTADRLLRLK